MGSVPTPPVLRPDDARPVEASRMGATSGAGFERHDCPPVAAARGAPSPRVTTSIGSGMNGLEPLPATLPARSRVIVPGTAEVPAPGRGSMRTHQNTRQRTSMLRRGGASGALVGSSNAVCAVRRAVPSVAES